MLVVILGNTISLIANEPAERGGSIIEPCVYGKKLECLQGNIPVVR